MRFFKKQLAPKEGQKGQSLVELALTLPVLLLLLTGLLDLGRAYFTYIALEEAAAEAALFLAIDPDCPDADSAPECINPNNALYRARTSGNDEFEFALTSWNIPYDGAAAADGFRSPFAQNAAGTPDSNCTAIGCTVIVQLRYDFPLFTPIIQNFVGDDGIELEVQASQIIVFELDE
ncbi:MAG: TadE/TadG family type IV pilus assembly protein [Chloroflexota bacterium]